MIETPRAACGPTRSPRRPTSSRFGTNDLTQMTFGFSRDDVEGRMMAGLPRARAAEAQPVRDHRRARRRRAGQARRPSGAGKAKPGLKLGVCGEHGGDPESIALFREAGLDYVSLLAVPGADRPAGRGPGGAGAPVAVRSPAARLADRRRGVSLRTAIVITASRARAPWSLDRGGRDLRLIAHPHQPKEPTRCSPPSLCAFAAECRRSAPRRTSPTSTSSRGTGSPCSASSPPWSSSTCCSSTARRT